jgi:DNA-binding HxlR family transcriptional regulator
MLSQTPKVLEKEGLVHRQEWDGKPPRVEYSLTESGQRISKLAWALSGFLRVASPDFGEDKSLARIKRS